MCRSHRIHGQISTYEASPSWRTGDPARRRRPPPSHCAPSTSTCRTLEPKHEGLHTTHYKLDTACMKRLMPAQIMLARSNSPREKFPSETALPTVSRLVTVSHALDQRYGHVGSSDVGRTEGGRGSKIASNAQLTGAAGARKPRRGSVVVGVARGERDGGTDHEVAQPRNMAAELARQLLCGGWEIFWRTWVDPTQIVSCADDRSAKIMTMSVKLCNSRRRRVGLDPDES